MEEQGEILPGLKIINDWNAQNLEAWCNKEISVFNSIAQLAYYESQAGRKLEHILFIKPSTSPEPFAGFYFGDDGAWYLEHGGGVHGKTITHHIHRQLIEQNAAILLTDWMHIRLGLEPKKKHYSRKTVKSN